MARRGGEDGGFLNWDVGIRITLDSLSKDFGGDILLLWSLLLLLHLLLLLLWLLLLLLVVVIMVMVV